MTQALQTLYGDVVELGGIVFNSGLTAPPPAWAKQELRRNRVPNPRGVGATSWTANYGTSGAGAVTAVSTGGPDGGPFARATWTTASTGTSGESLRHDGRAAQPLPIPVTPGEVVSAAIEARCSVGQRLSAQVWWFDAAGSQTGISPTANAGTASVVTANTWNRLTLAGVTVPAGAVYALVGVARPTGTGGVVFPVGATLDATKAQLETVSTIGDYFDGDTADLGPEAERGAYTYSWTGAANASPSIYTRNVASGLVVANAKMGVDGIVGWDDTPELTYVSTNWPNRDGATWAEGGTHFRARGLSVQGYIVADRRDHYLQARNALTRAVVTKKELVLRRGGLVPKELRVRLAGQITFPDEIEEGSRFEIPLLAPDPFKRSVSATDLTVGVQAPSSWVRKYPRKYPLKYTASVYQVEKVTDTNWVVDPSFEAATSQWSRTSAGGTLSTSVQDAQNRTKAATLGWTALSTTTTARTVTFPINGLMSGEPFAVSVAARYGTAHAKVTVTAEFLDASNNVIGTVTSLELDVPSGTPFTRIQATGTVPYGATQARVSVNAYSTTAASGNVVVDSVMLNRVAGATYFDGATSGCQWTSSADLSPSQKFSLVALDTTLGSKTFDNVGDWEEWPVSKVTGPLPYGWLIRNATTGEELGFAYQLRAGQVMTVDHRAQVATLDNGDHAENVYFGTWWSLAPGPNALELYSPTYNGEAKWELSPRSRWA